MHLLELNHDILHALSAFLAPAQSLVPLMCTCRAAHRIFAPALYRDIVVWKDRSAAALCRTLLAHPARIALIRTLRCAMHDAQFLNTPHQNSLTAVLGRAAGLQELSVSLMEFFDAASGFLAALAQLGQLRALALSVLPSQQCRALSRHISPRTLRSLNLELKEEMPDILHVLAPFAPSLECLVLSFPIRWGEATWCRTVEIDPARMHWPRVSMLGLIYAYLAQPAALSEVFPSVRALDVFGQPALAGRGARWPHLQSLEINSFALACQLVDWRATGAVDRVFLSDYWLGLGTADFERAPLAHVRAMLAASRPQALLLQIRAPLAPPVCTLLAEHACSLHYLALHVRWTGPLDEPPSQHALEEFIPHGLHALPIWYFALSVEVARIEALLPAGADLCAHDADARVERVLARLVRAAVVPRLPHARVVELSAQFMVCMWEIGRGGGAALRVVPQRHRAQMRADWKRRYGGRSRVQG